MARLDNEKLRKELDARVNQQLKDNAAFLAKIGNPEKFTQNLKQKYRDIMKKMSNQESESSEEEIGSNEDVLARLQKLNEDPQFRLSRDIFSAYSQNEEDFKEDEKSGKLSDLNPSLKNMKKPNRFGCNVEMNPEFQELMKEIEEELEKEYESVKQIKMMREKEIEENRGKPEKEDKELTTEEKELAEEIRKKYLPSYENNLSN